MLYDLEQNKIISLIGHYGIILIWDKEKFLNFQRVLYTNNSIQTYFRYFLQNRLALDKLTYTVEMLMNRPQTGTG